MNPEDVLQVAMRAYWHEGPEVSVNAVCRRAGVSKPSLYREFGSEDGLSASALEQYASIVLGQRRDLLLSGQSFFDKLDALITYASEDPRNEHGCLFFKMRAVRLHLGLKTQAKVAEIEAEAIKLYARFFRESRERGEWLGNISPDFAAQYLHAQMGLAVSQRALGTETAIVRPLLEYALSVLRKP
jgi:AcrR family transcriptional regulator